MKKFLFVASVLIMTLASCTTTKKTATSMDVNNYVGSKNTVELEVSDTRISYDFYTTKSIRRGGRQNVYDCATAEALMRNGNADVLVAPEYETYIRKGLFGPKKIKRVVVSGFPAKYKNFKIEK